MGTNYYFKKECEHCGFTVERMHIGKSSAGWAFLLHVEPSDSEFPHSLEEWIDLIVREQAASIDWKIVDEYGVSCPLSTLLQIILVRSNPTQLQRLPALDPTLVSRGAGTWDCTSGDFS